jgi:hypothetical protein
VHFYRPSLPPSLGRRLLFNIRSVLYYKFSKRDSLYLIYFLLPGDTIFIFRVCCNYSRSFPGHGSATAHSWLFAYGAGRIGTKYGRLKVRECGTLWMCICNGERVVAFFSSSAVSLNAMGTRKRAFDASYSIMESDVQSVAAACSVNALS